MSIQKLADRLEQKIAAFQAAGAIQQAMSLASEIMQNLTVYDPGYEETRQLAGTLYGRWKTIQSTQTTEFPDLEEVKKLSLSALEKLTGDDREKMKTVVRLLHTL